MKKAVKVLQARRDAILTAVTERPGVTTAELASIIGVDGTKFVSNAMWQLLKSGKVLAEQIVRDGRHMNAYYRPERIGSDSVARVRQKLVDAAEVVPMHRSKTVPNSVFDVPRATRSGKKRTARKAPALPQAAPAATIPPEPPAIAARRFACAVTNDGSLVLMREGQIEFSLSDIEAATLQNYLLKRAAANLFANMV